MSPNPLVCACLCTKKKMMNKTHTCMHGVATGYNQCSPQNAVNTVNTTFEISKTLVTLFTGLIVGFTDAGLVHEL